MIPDRPVEATESAAELRLFERLRDETSDDLVAFHSVAWLVPGERGRRPQQGEADFVLAHPEYGVLTLEVKGGGIGFDAESGTWQTTGRQGEAEIQDPVRQASRNSHLLGRALARAKRGGAVAGQRGSRIFGVERLLQRLLAAAERLTVDLVAQEPLTVRPSRHTPAYARHVADREQVDVLPVAEGDGRIIRSARREALARHPSETDWKGFAPRRHRVVHQSAT